MSSLTPLFAAAWETQLQEIHDKGLEYLEKAGVPQLPTMPELWIPADVALILGAIALLVAVWRLVHLRIFRALFAVIAALLIAYYPAAYGFHFWFFNRPEMQVEDREVPNWEAKVQQNWRWIDYGILGGGVLIGGTLLIVTRPKRNDDEGEHLIPDQSTEEAPWHESQRQVQQQQHRSRGGSSQKNPFDFS